MNAPVSENVSFARLGDDMLTEFRRLSRIGLPTDEFWARLAHFTIERFEINQRREEGTLP